MAPGEQANQAQTAPGNNEVHTTTQAEMACSESEFVVEPYRQELLAHCYRLVGSLHDAEDAVQDTMLRAWRHFETFTEKGPGSLRAWLYRIATNTSLDILKKRSPRTLPTLATPEWDPHQPVAARSGEALWLQPFPDSWLAEAVENPEARYTRSESISLAFLTALQLLPARQRAILLLSDVLEWRAVEVAQLLDISVSAVNSALHRARVTLASHYQVEPPQVEARPSADLATRSLLSRYVQAWETDDVAELVALMKEDATLSMPPVPSWYRGRAAIQTILRSILFPPGVCHRWRLFPTRANQEPAFMVYRADETTQTYQAFALQIVTIDRTQPEPGQIASVTAFLDPRLAHSFGFPLQRS